MARLISILILLFLAIQHGYTQELKPEIDYFILDAEQNDPLYTTYAAAMERSRLYGDKAYKMVYYDQNRPISYENDKGGESYNIWLVNGIAIIKTADFHQKPVVKASYSDMAILEYQPFKDLKVQETFFVYSSKISLSDMVITNTGDRELSLSTFPVFELGNDSLIIEKFDKSTNGYIVRRNETHKRLISGLYSKGGYPSVYREIFASSFAPYTYGGFKGDMDDFYLTIKTDHYAEDKYNDTLNQTESGMCDFIVLQGKQTIKPGETLKVRYIRAAQNETENLEELQNEVKEAMSMDLKPFLQANEDLYKNIPQIDFDTKDEKLVYIGALNLARGCMLPPTGETKHNFYVFSRNPLWGWGHGHQVLHESLAMIAYAYLDPQSAQESQRVYMEQQGEDGLIAYRHGPRGMQDYPHFSKITNKDMSTTSAPFFSWINHEIYKVSKDRKFLQEAYDSGVKYTNWLIENRDLDKDGTFEWGPYGIIENVRDWFNAVFQVSAERYLNVDKEDISDELECLDLTVMVAKEMRSLSAMAKELGKKKEAKKWTKKADEIAELVNELMWDEETEFYYSVNKENHSFKYMTRDLRRPEIIGFLTLWAEVATKDRAKTIVKKYLLNPDHFWRKYGVPTLSASDEWYSPDVDYCCKWNGPVWLLWDYMVYDGLRNYGFDEEADELAGKMMLAVTTQLSKNHNYWESFSPDNEVLNSPTNYIWDAIMAKILVDLYENK